MTLTGVVLSCRGGGGGSDEERARTLRCGRHWCCVAMGVLVLVIVVLMSVFWVFVLLVVVAVIVVLVLVLVVVIVICHYESNNGVGSVAEAVATAGRAVVDVRAA